MGLLFWQKRKKMMLLNFLQMLIKMMLLAMQMKKMRKVKVRVRKKVKAEMLKTKKNLMIGKSPGKL